MEAISYAVADLGTFLWTWIFSAVLIFGGIYFTVKTKFVQFTTFSDFFRIVSGKDKKKGDSNVGGTDKPKASLSAFQSFCISESSRVGTGNVVGVAVAIASGGPGAVFWMWMMAIVGAATGFCEALLGQVYKENHGDRFMGGPMYYFQKAYKSKAPSYIVAIIIAVTYAFIFNSIQVNTITDNFKEFVPNRIFIGIALALVFLFISFGGINRITKISTILTPFVVITYMLVCTGIILFNLPMFFKTIGYIVQGAFGYEQIAGGAIGFTIGQAIQQGLRRGLFSNEAGLGTVTIPASTSNVSHPVKQGLVQGAGVIIDTVIICSATAFVIIMSGAHTEGTSGVILVRSALAHWIGDFAMPFLYLMLFLLPFTSIIGNYFYGETCARFALKKQNYIICYRLLAAGMIVFASLAPLQLVWNVADLFTGTLVTLNIIVLFKLSKVIIACLEDYRKKLKAFKEGTGEEPVFYDDEIGIDTPYWKRGR